MADTLIATRTSPLDEETWEILLERIADENCTPFLGSEVCLNAIPASSEIAGEWAKKYGYPMNDVHNLPRVAQFMATKYDRNFPKERLRERFKETHPPDFRDPDEPHRVLAGLNLPVYVTTSYYDFMVQALEFVHKKPRRAICCWRESEEDHRNAETNSASAGGEPSPATPIVYHLHGNICKPKSLVLTEDDYLDFLVETSRDSEIIPSRIQEAFTATSMLFLGYRLDDLEFRVVLRGLANHLRINGKAHLYSLQLVTVEDQASSPQFEKARAYLGKYFNTLDIRTYWGTTREFVAELRQRWEEHERAK